MSDATKRFPATSRGPASKGAARSDSVRQDSTNRQTHVAGPASTGVARSEAVPVDSTHRMSGSVRGPGPYSVESSKSFYDKVDHSTSKEPTNVDNHTVSQPMAGSTFPHAQAPKYQR